MKENGAVQDCFFLFFFKPGAAARHQAATKLSIYLFFPFLQCKSINNLEVAGPDLPSSSESY